jgi:hypothetical protein
MRTLCLAVTGLAVSWTASADPQPGAIDLLHAVPSTIAVSSTVDNTRYRPEHLIDGDLGTAWNSRTGDLVGAWIAFRVPGDVHVSTIRMTVGFTRIENHQDYFTMNPRIRKVTVYRNGKVVGEHRLDIESRQLQDIAVDSAGGDFQIVINEIEPGSKSNWREVCVSELAVLGEVVANGAPTHAIPTVRVGALDAQPPAAKEPAAKPVVPQAQPVLLALPSSAVTALVLERAAATFTANGKPIVVDGVMLQPIAETKMQRGAWIGRKLQLEAKDGPTCSGVITSLAVMWTRSVAPGHAPDPVTFARVFQQLRPEQRALVGIVTPDRGATCKKSLWAHDPATTVQRGRLERSRYRDRYLADADQAAPRPADDE